MFKRAGLVVTLLALCGCCATVPRAEKYFDRRTPQRALQMLQYATEAEQYDVAYACLTQEAREKASLTRFKLALRFVNIEEWGGVSLRDLVVDGIQVPDQSQPGIIGPGSYGVTVVYFPEDEEDDIVEQTVTMMREGDEWFLDPLRIKGIHFR